MNYETKRKTTDITRAGLFPTGGKGRGGGSQFQVPPNFSVPNPGESLASRAGAELAASGQPSPLQHPGRPQEVSKPVRGDDVQLG